MIRTKPGCSRDWLLVVSRRRQRGSSCRVGWSWQTGKLVVSAHGLNERTRPTVYGTPHLLSTMPSVGGTKLLWISFFLPRFLLLLHLTQPPPFSWSHYHHQNHLLSFSSSSCFSSSSFSYYSYFFVTIFSPPLGSMVRYNATRQPLSEAPLLSLRRFFIVN